MKFVLIKKAELEPKTINVVTNAFYSEEDAQVLETVDINVLKETLEKPPIALYINVRGHYLTEVLLKTITPAYLRGTQVTINGFKFKKCTGNPLYKYVWQENVPAKLPTHLKEAYYNFDLRGELFKELVAWNQSRCNRAFEKSKFKWSLAEDFYKDLFKTFKSRGITVQSPNKKTWFEAMAELELAQTIYPEEPLTQTESDYLEKASLLKYVRAFGLQDPTINIGMHHRTTPHGSTDEPMLISAHELEQAKISVSFNKSEHRQQEGYLNEETGFETITWNSTSVQTVTLIRRQRENIETLKWFLSQTKDIQSEFLLPGWHFCPECGRLYNEQDGCYDQFGNCHVEPVGFEPYNDETHDNSEDEFEFDFDF